MDTDCTNQCHCHYRSHLNNERCRKGEIIMERYITRGIASNLPTILQQQLWKLVAQRENEQSKELEEIDYFHIFQFNMHNNQLYIKHKQERPEYVKIHKANYSKAIDINKVYVIREDDVDLSYYVMLLPDEY